MGCNPRELGFGFQMQSEPMFKSGTTPSQGVFLQPPPALEEHPLLLQIFLSLTSLLCNAQIRASATPDSLLQGTDKARAAILSFPESGLT